jgi:superfamily I DNA/RNA helicase
VARILEVVSSFLGIGHVDDESPDALSCPESVVAKGPAGLAAYLQDVPPFDRLFWQSQAFRDLVRAYDEHEGWAGLMNWVHLQSELDLVASRSEKVQIMTLHAAKGLEFEAVFLPCLEDGILPFAGPAFLSGKAGEGALERLDEEEERRLFYVGLTRARRELFLSRAGHRRLFGREMRLGPSRFLEAMLDGEAQGLTRSTLVARTERKEKSLSLL